MPTAQSINPPSEASRRITYTFELTILTSLFFMWGFITCLNDILIPHLKAVFALNYARAMLIQFCFFAAYFLVSLPSGIVVDRIGYKKGIVVGLITAGFGCFMFYPAAGLRSYALFLWALFVLASGITLLQVAANPYVAILGKPETASSRLNLTQAFNSLGTTVAPYIGSLLILSVAVKSTEEMGRMNLQELSVYQTAQASAVQYPYVTLAATLLLIAVVIAVIKLPVVQGGAVSVEGIHERPPDSLHPSAWRYRHLMLGAVAIFLYVGGEVAIGSFLVNFIGQANIAGLPEAEAGKFVSFYWGGAMVGRFVGAAIQRKTRPGTVLGCNALFAALLVITTMISQGHVAMWALLSVGFFNSIMFPTIFTLGIAGLGRHTGQGSGILCMAIVGGAVIPLLQGLLADRIGIHHAFILPVLCYLYIAYYGLKGHVPSPTR